MSVVLNYEQLPCRSQKDAQIYFFVVLAQQLSFVSIWIKLLIENRHRGLVQMNEQLDWGWASHFDKHDNLFYTSIKRANTTWPKNITPPIVFLSSLTKWDREGAKVDFTTSNVTRSSARLFILIRRWLSKGLLMQQKLFVGDTHGTIHQENSDKRQEDIHGASTSRHRGNCWRHGQILKGNFDH